MSTPTLRILTFFPPSVNGELAAVLLNNTSRHPVTLDGTVSVMRELAVSILAATGGTPFIRRPRKPSSGRHRSIPDSVLVKYHAVLDHIVRGQSWKVAAAAEGLNEKTVQAWAYRTEAMEAARKRVG